MWACPLCSVIQKDEEEQMVTINGEQVLAAGKRLSEYLTEQEYNVKRIAVEINPYLEIATDWVKLTEENMKEILQENYICEAFDSPEQKAMLTNFVLEHMPEKYLVGASGMAGYGRNNEIVTRQILPRYYLCGDGVSGLEEGRGLMAPRVMLCAAHQANQILELLIEAGEEQV